MKGSGRPMEKSGGRMPRGEGLAKNRARAEVPCNQQPQAQLPAAAAQAYALVRSSAMHAGRYQYEERKFVSLIQTDLDLQIKWIFDGFS